MSNNSTDYGYAIVNADGVICSLHEEYTEEGWGETRELVQLVRVHKEGDVIDWGPDGVEIESGLDDEDCSGEDRDAAARAPGARLTVEIDDGRTYVIERRICSGSWERDPDRPDVYATMDEAVEEIETPHTGDDEFDDGDVEYRVVGAT